jgi:bifunctional non-homologous end joining protein LigD
LWCFDVLHLDGLRITGMPLCQRKEILSELVTRADDEHLQFSGEFENPEGLLAVDERTGLEGIVSKWRDCAYRSGTSRDWLMVKTAGWRLAHWDRWEMFQKLTPRT